jgi:succinate-semialdehyde dehydrogenase/glutarate-semialdehyde dehydrogenase
VLRFTETQAVATQRLVRIAPQLGLSDAAYARLMSANLRVLKKLGRA